ncbi:MAG: hypothetical protein P8J55_02060 [Pseudomonadales bacterium]|nr:hypothetical protein [Pseudomonadales bacterium]
MNISYLAFTPWSSYSPREVNPEAGPLANAAEASTGSSSVLHKLSIREASLTAGPITVKSSRLLVPILP